MLKDIFELVRVKLLDLINFSLKDYLKTRLSMSIEKVVEVGEGNYSPSTLPNSTKNLMLYLIKWSNYIVMHPPVNCPLAEWVWAWLEINDLIFYSLTGDTISGTDIKKAIVTFEKYVVLIN